MIRKISLIVSLIFLRLAAPAQIPYSILPYGIIGIHLVDTMLNTKEVLQKAGIRSYSYEIIPAPEKNIATQTVNVNRQGNIVAYQTCIPKSSASKGFCFRDTFLYDEKDRLAVFISFDGHGKETYKRIADYSNAEEVKFTNLIAAPHADTFYQFRDYNQLGLLAGIMHISNINDRKNIAYTKLYYNRDGGLDSAHDGLSQYGTVIFKKKVKNDQTILEAANKAHRFKWTYDTSGKCIEMEWNGIKQKASSKFINRYFYNGDGTLAKVIEKNRTLPEYVISYTYEKW